MGSDGRSRMLKSMKPEHKPDARVLAAYKAQWNGAGSQRAEKSWQSECHGGAAQVETGCNPC